MKYLGSLNIHLCANLVPSLYHGLFLVHKYLEIKKYMQLMVEHANNYDNQLS